MAEPSRADRLRQAQYPWDDDLEAFVRANQPCSRKQIDEWAATTSWRPYRNEVSTALQRVRGRGRILCTGTGAKSRWRAVEE